MVITVTKILIKLVSIKITTIKTTTLEMDHRREITKYIERHTLKSMLTIILIHIKEHHIPKVNMESLMPNTMRKVIREEVETMRLIKLRTIKSTSLVNINNSIDKQLFLTVE